MFLTAFLGSLELPSTVFSISETFLTTAKQRVSDMFLLEMLSFKVSFYYLTFLFFILQVWE